jgi:Fe-Mn family superoxide dismutase
MAYQLPDLAYSYEALEPHLDARTMEIHHSKHHAGYTQKTNAALEGYPELHNKSIEEVLSDLDVLPEEIRTAVRNNGGGYANHNLYWRIMGPGGGGEPDGPLGRAIGQAFGDFSSFQNEFSSAAATQFGSGWAWLITDAGGGLRVHKTSNQDTPLSIGAYPLMTLDVWEHAYYLKYQNRRMDFIAAWWNVINWAEVSRIYESSIA